MTKRRSLNYTILIYLSIFMIIVVLVLVVFQVFLLEPMYLNYKSTSIINVADEVIDQIEDTETTSEVEDVIFEAQLKSDSCIRVVGNDPMKYANEFDDKCFIYRMRPKEFQHILDDTDNAEDGEYLEIQQDNHRFNENDLKTIIYSKKVDHKDIDYVIVQTNVTPIDATIQTLTVQLIYIGIFMVILVIIFTFIITRRLAKPLVDINDAAKTISNGYYNSPDNVNNYLEAEELDATLQQASVDINKADKAKRDLIANVSHDLRTPLTMISGYGEMMKDLPDENNEENLDVIINESKRLSVLVNDLLDLSKLQENEIVLNKEVFDITELINDQLKKYEVYVAQDGFKIETFVGDEVLVNADKLRIQQVFNNFVQNAIQHSNENKHVVIKEIVTDDSVQIQVTDEGEGIKEEDIPNIWDRYFKVDKQHQRNGESGSGIGLAIVKEILELHEAKYGVTSEYGKGSTFWFELPIIKEERM